MEQGAFQKLCDAFLFSRDNIHPRSEGGVADYFPTSIFRQYPIKCVNPKWGDNKLNSNFLHWHIYAYGASFIFF